MENPDLVKIDRWLEQATKEIVLSEPGTDRSQFPLRDLLSNLAEKAGNIESLSAFHQCASAATEFVEEILFSGQAYSSAQLDALNAFAEQLNRLRRDPALPFVRPEESALVVPAAGESAAGEDAVPEKHDEFAVIDLAKDGDLLREFATESREHLENIEHGILILEEQPGDVDTLNSIFRAFHTFKGGSGFLHLVPVNRLSHELESLLDSARSGRIPITLPIINLILESSDVLKSFIDELQRQLDFLAPVAPIRVPTEGLIERARDILMEKSASDVESVAAAPADSVAAPSTASRASSVAYSVIKVDTRKFDSLVDLVGELVIAQSLVAQDSELLRIRSPLLTRNLAQLHRITNELQKTAMSLRMVPIRNTFQKMNRLVRDLTARNGKQVELTLHGEDTEMDRTIVEELADPIMHMIRNSVDHGIEPPEAREASGKTKAGRIFLSATHQGGNIVIEIGDDGAGLSPQKLLAKAIERGIVPPDTRDSQLSEKEIFDLIFAAGFSTAEKVTDISGRGVGMDVVKRNIMKLRGKIEIASTIGQGTTFKIYLPLTLAIIDGLVVRVGDQRYIIPTLSVRESFRPTAGMISTVCERGEMVNVRGKLRPMLRLYDYFGVEPRTTDPAEGLVIVVESAHQERCVLVDDLIGQQEVVIKSLGDHFKNNKALAGAAILGDGRVGLILEPRALVQIEFSDALAA